MSQRHRVPSPFLEQHCSLGLGKLTENQLKPIMDLVKSQDRLRIKPPPEPTGDKAIIIAAGGKYDAHGYVNARWLRHSGIQHPIQIWHFPKEYAQNKARKAFEKLDVELVDVGEVLKKHWHRDLTGWFLKEYAMMHTPYEEVVFYDADCFASCDPDQVWSDPEYQEKGALFFSDVAPCRANTWHYVFASVRIPDKETESGCFFWNRVKAWNGIRMVNWMSENHKPWTKFTHGDKEFLYLGFETTKTPYIQSQECRWTGAGIEQSWKGNVICLHEMAAKRGESKFTNKAIPGFFEEWKTLTM